MPSLRRYIQREQWETGKKVNAAMLAIEDVINTTCPWSGRPVAADALSRYRGAVVGFCNPGCRDKFDAALAHFDARLDGPASDSATDLQV